MSERGEKSNMTWTSEEIYREVMEALGPKPKPLPKPPLKPTEKAQDHWANPPPTEAVIQGATTHNSALAERLGSAEGKINLTEWQQSVLDVQRAVVRRGKGAKR